MPQATKGHRSIRKEMSGRDPKAHPRRDDVLGLDGGRTVHVQGLDGQGRVTYRLLGPGGGMRQSALDSYRKLVRNALILRCGS